MEGEVGDELKGVEGGETEIRIYCMKYLLYMGIFINIYIFLALGKIKIKNLKSLTSG